jgi:hypothetical protein
MRRNDAGERIYPGTLTHEPIVTNELFGRARTVAGGGTRPACGAQASPFATTLRAARPHPLRRLRAADAGQLQPRPRPLRCRYPGEYAVVNEVDHTRNVHLREDAVVGPLAGWLAQVFDPANIDETLESMHAASEWNDGCGQGRRGIQAPGGPRQAPHEVARRS